MPDTGLIVIGSVTSTAEVKANAVSWITQSLAEEAQARTDERSPTACGSPGPSGPRADPRRAVAQSYLALLLARAGTWRRRPKWRPLPSPP